MHGNNAYAIAKIRGTKENFLKNNTYDAQYYAVNGKLMTTNAYFIPNAWIIDAVNLSYKDNDHHGALCLYCLIRVILIVLITKTIRVVLVQL